MGRETPIRLIWYHGRTRRAYTAATETILPTDVTRTRCAAYNLNNTNYRCMEFHPAEASRHQRLKIRYVYRYSLCVGGHIPSHGISGVGDTSDFVFQLVQVLSSGWVHLSIGARAGFDAKSEVDETYRKVHNSSRGRLFRRRTPQV